MTNKISLTDLQNQAVTIIDGFVTSSVFAKLGSQICRLIVFLDSNKFDRSQAKQVDKNLASYVSMVKAAVAANNAARQALDFAKYLITPRRQTESDWQTTCKEIRANAGAALSFAKNVTTTVLFAHEKGFFSLVRRGVDYSVPLTLFAAMHATLSSYKSVCKNAIKAAQSKGDAEAIADLLSDGKAAVFLSLDLAGKTLLISPKTRLVFNIATAAYDVFKQLKVNLPLAPINENCKILAVV